MSSDDLGLDLNWTKFQEICINLGADISTMCDTPETKPENEQTKKRKRTSMHDTECVSMDVITTVPKKRHRSYESADEDSVTSTSITHTPNSAVCLHQHLKYFTIIVSHYAKCEWFKMDKDEAMKMVIILHKCALSSAENSLVLSNALKYLWRNYVLRDCQVSVGEM